MRYGDAVTTIGPEGIARWMLIITLIEIIRRLVSFLYLLWMKERSSNCSAGLPGVNINTFLKSENGSVWLGYLFMGLAFFTTTVYRWTFLDILTQSLICLVPYFVFHRCFITSPENLMSEENNGIGAFQAVNFFSFVENAAELPRSGGKLKQGGHDLDDSTEAALKTKLVILFPSPKYLLGKGYLSSEGATDAGNDVRNLLEAEAKARGGDFSEENTQLGLCSNIVKVDDILRDRKGEKPKMEIRPMMDCEYFISGQARKVNVSLVSWKNETRTGDRRENKIGVLDNRPLNTLVSWKEGENVSFEGFSNQYDIYMRTLQRLVVEKGLEDSLYLHRFEEQLSHFEESLNNLEQNVIRQN